MRASGSTTALPAARIPSERAVVLAHMDSERVALEGFFRAERRALVADVASERDAALRQADGITQGLVDQVFARLQQVLLRAVVAALGLILLAAFCGWLLLSRGRRRGIPAPSTDPRARATLTEREA